MRQAPGLSLKAPVLQSLGLRLAACPGEMLVEAEGCLVLYELTNPLASQLNWR